MIKATCTYKTLFKNHDTSKCTCNSKFPSQVLILYADFIHVHEFNSLSVEQS